MCRIDKNSYEIFIFENVHLKRICGPNFRDNSFSSNKNKKFLRVLRLYYVVAKVQPKAVYIHCKKFIHLRGMSYLIKSVNKMELKPSFLEINS